MEDLRATLDRQRTAFATRRPELAQRLAALEALQRAVANRRQEFVEAISADFGGRSAEETLFLEVVPLLEELRHLRRHLKRWTAARTTRSGRFFFPARSKILLEPLGVVGIIGAWNYPLLLMLSPLAGALAAGNHAILKPSEIAPATAELIRNTLAELFPPDYVAVAGGGPEVSAALAGLPLDHLIFTGSQRAARDILRAAAENLTPVTLELGGKSPCLIHRNYPLERAVRRIMAGKLYNAGQTCVAPDYVLVPEDRLDAFLGLAKEAAARLYPVLVNNPDYTRIITRRHYTRLTRLIEDARGKGAAIIEINPAGEACNEENRVLPPTLISGVTTAMSVMQEEIFGPILPLAAYSALDEAIHYINARPHPLALYYFDTDSTRINEVLTRTTSGGVTVNDVIYHFAQNTLPFGGVGPSGMGHYHGVHSIETFSKKKGIFFQSRLSVTGLFHPPYRRLAKSLLTVAIGR